MKKINSEKIKVGDKIVMEEWPSHYQDNVYFLVEYIGNTRFTGTIYFHDKKSEDFYLKSNEWCLYEESKKKLVAPFAFQDILTEDSSVDLCSKFVTEEEAKKLCTHSKILIKWYAELAVEVDDE